VPALDRALLAAVLAGFLGTRSQTPPMYSALKQGGQPLYKLARAGISVPRAARTIELTRLDLLAVAKDSLEIEALCSKGTYVRVLAEEIAQALGTCGHVSALRRLWVEPFVEAPMQTLESLAQARARDEWPPLMPIDAPLGHLPQVSLSGLDEERIVKGQRIFVGPGNACERVRLYGAGGNFLGLGAQDGAGGLEPRRLMRTGG
jgi:tRNA pseudouridine55 synthase